MVETVGSIIDRIQPERTVLLFGAGSSIPSKAPTSEALTSFMAKRFGLPLTGFSLPEIASLAERKAGRRSLIGALREQFQNLKPTGGLLNLPLYNWKSLFTTNFDDLIEQCYRRRDMSISAYSSDFDFRTPDNPAAQKIFKLHGTIEKDEADGHRSRLIITDGDYDLTSAYREQLYNRLTDEQRCSTVNCFGRTNLINAIKLLYEDGFAGALGLADADFDRLTGDLEVHEGLIYSDAHDFDIDWACEHSLSRYLHEVGDPAKCVAVGNAAGVAALIFKAVKPLSVLRYVNHHQRLRYKLSNVRHDDVVSDGEIDISLLVDHVSTGAFSPAAKKQALERLIKD